MASELFSSPKAFLLYISGWRIHGPAPIGNSSQLIAVPYDELVNWSWNSLVGCERFVNLYEDPVTLTLSLSTDAF